MNPGLVIEVVPSNRLQNLLRRNSDIAVRMQRPHQLALIAKRIGSTEIGLYAHRSYIERHGLPAHVGDLQRHRLIGFDRDDTAFRSAGRSLGPITRESFGYRSDSDVAQLAAVRAGIGIGGCQVAIAARSSDLIAVLPRQVSFNLEIWVAMHEKLAFVRRVRLAFEALCDGLRAFVRSSKQ